LPFTRLVNECQRPRFGELGCPLAKLVGAHELVAGAVTTIVYELSVCTDAAGLYRVPPMLCSRLARGGKTTLLCLIFDALKQREIYPIFITFNGSSTFISREGESQTEAILRSIALQLVDASGLDPTCLVCNEKALDEYLGDFPVVLIIDELNALAVPIDADAGRMLRQLFLDKQNRYLVFSSHVPISVEPKLSTYIKSTYETPSQRGCRLLGFSPCSDLALLRNMSPQCASLNPAEAMLYGGIPSLIYSVKALGEMSPMDRFQKKINPGTFNPNLSLFSVFVAALVNGLLSPDLLQLEEFGILTDQNRMTWPLCYIECIVLAFNLPSHTEFITQNITSLWTHASNAETGKDWECVINIALAFQCLHYSLRGRKAPFNEIPHFQVPGDENMKLIFCTLPGDCQTIESAMTYLDISCENNVLILAVPSYAKFIDFDGFLLRKIQSKVVVCAYQAKLGRGYPKRVLSNDFVHGYLLRGTPVDESRLCKGWNYLGADSLATLLGYSLMRIAPSTWPALPSVDSFA
jgi:hypothetical protein